jgi:selenide, water dikinase
VLRHVKPISTDPAVIVGLDKPDDAGVYRVAPDLALVQTVDFFTPIVDDPFDWGRVAAVNALSDVYAMGARPATALNLVGWPRSLDFELLGRVLEGASEACVEAGVAVIGGHSVDDPEPKFGLAVTGFVHPDRIVTTSGAEAGADLVLTKPLGMGVISTALKEGRAEPAIVERAIEIMGTLNKAASEAMLEAGVQAATDVTGFGLVGHLYEMLGSSLSATISFEAVPFVPGADKLAAEGLLPGGSKRNLEALGDVVDTGPLGDAHRALLFDAQTSGGLLIAVHPSKTKRLMDALGARGVADAAVIGRLEAGNGRITVTQ